MSSRTRLAAVFTALVTTFALVPAVGASAHHRDGHQRGPDAAFDRDVVSTAQKSPAPTDYTQVQGLSQPVFERTILEEYRVPLHDGEEMYVQVTRPDPAVHGPRRVPVVMEVSPYHGTIADRDGIRIFPDPTDVEGNQIGLTGYFAPRGYAVVIADLRGTGRSSGCLDHLGQNDAKDLKTVVEWAADQEWSTGRVGLTGHSYVGSTPSIAAAQNPRGLAAIAPSAGLASMYDHQFQFGVPYYLQWAGPQWAYEGLAMGADGPPGVPDPVYGYEWGDNWDNHEADETGCGWQNSAFTAGHGQATGEYQAWHAERDHREGASNADVPIFMIHGVNDNAARIPAAEWFFGHRFDRSQDKVWLGQWDHGSAGNTTCSEGHVNCRFEQWQYALHAWFDKHLQGRDVDTGPPVEVFLNGDQVLTDSSWSAPEKWIGVAPDAAADTVVFGEPEEAGSASFTAFATGPSSSGSSMEFVSEPLSSNLTVTGLPQLRLHASQTSSQALNLVTVLERQDEDGERHPMTYCAIQTQLRNGPSTPKAIVPGEKMEMSPQCFTMAHHVETGEQLVFSVRTSSPHHLSSHSEDLNVTVFTGPGETAFALPVVENPTLYEDLPVGVERDIAELPDGQAQQTVTGSVNATLPGTYVHAGPITSSYFEFDVAGMDDGVVNAKLEAFADFGAPGDYDLYLQRQEEDGSWSSNLASGTSGSLENEQLTHFLPEPGHYRLEVHNWLGTPGAPIDLTITFFNKDGEPGPDPE